MASNDNKKAPGSLSDSNWFPHDCDTTTDPKIGALLDDFGAAGYGIFWHICELIHAETETRIPAKKYVYKSIAKAMSVGVEMVERVVEACKDYDLFDELDGFLSSARARRNKTRRDEVKQMRREAGKKGGQATQAKGKQSSSNGKAKPNHTSSNGQSNVKQVKAEERRGEEILSVGESISDLLSLKDSNGVPPHDESLWRALCEGYPKIPGNDWKEALNVWNDLTKSDRVELVQNLRLDLENGQLNELVHNYVLQ